MDGIYAIFYTGSAGSGHAIIVMKNGIIAGADAIGGILDGTYTDPGDGFLEVAVFHTAPPGASLVTGVIAGQKSLSQEINTRLPQNFGNGKPVLIQTPTGPINVIFKRLRDAP
jgi:hypothetical protein